MNCVIVVRGGIIVRFGVCVCARVYARRCVIFKEKKKVWIYLNVEFHTPRCLGRKKETSGGGENDICQYV